MLSLDAALMLAQLVTFLIGLALLWRLAYRPLARLIRERGDKIAGDLQAAAEARGGAERARADAEAERARLAEQARDLSRQAAREAQQAREDILRAARQEGEALVRRAQAAVGLEKEKALKELRQAVIALSLHVAEKVVGGVADPALHRRLAERALADLEKETPP